MKLTHTKNSVRLAGVFLLFLLSFSALSPRAFSQLNTGSLEGVVHDASDNVLTDTRVNLVNEQTGITRSAATDSEGRYRFIELPVGSYALRIEHDGFKTVTIPGVAISVAHQTVEDASLEIGEISEHVNVEASSSDVDTSSPTLGGYVSPQRVASLPLNGRNYVDLVFLQPGITLNTSRQANGGTVGSWFSSNGAPIRSNAQLLDGASVTSLSGAAGASVVGATLGVDGIQEFRVINGYVPAEYGGSLGAQVVIASRGGSNQFHGDVFEYLRNSALDAKYTLLQPTQPKQAFRRNQFGASVGGPILKDKFFFNAVFEALKAAQPVPTTQTTIGPGCVVAGGTKLTNQECPQLQLPASTPSITVNDVTAKVLSDLRPSTSLVSYSATNPSQFTYVFPQHQDDYYGQARVDYTFSSKDSAFFRYTIDKATQPSTNYGWPYFYQNGKSRGDLGTVSETHVFSPSLLNTAGFSYTGITINITCSADVPSGSSILNVGLGMGTLTVPGITNYGACVSNNFQRKLFYSFRDDLLYTHGAHEIKAGVMYNRDVPSISSPVNQRGIFTFPSFVSLFTGDPSSFTFRASGPLNPRAFAQNEYAFYVRDDWKIRKNLTINLGLRYEPWSRPDETSGRQSWLESPFVDPTQTSFQAGNMIRKNVSLWNLSPRVGLAWDVRGDGKTAVRASFVQLYDQTPLPQSYINVSTATPPFSSVVAPSFTGQAAATWKLGLPVTSLAANAAGTATIPFPTPDSVVRPSVQPIQYRLKQPYLDSWTASVQQQLPASATLTVAYVGTRGVHLMRNSEVNPNKATQITDGVPYWAPGGTRLNPNFASILQSESTAESSYHALQTQVTGNIRNKVQFQASYTWSRLIDNGQAIVIAETAASPLQSPNPYNSRWDRSSSVFDTPHNLRLNAIYHLPTPSRQKTLLGGWWVSSIFTAQSGLPFTPQVSFNNSRSGVNNGIGAERPSYVTEANLTSAKALDPNAVIFDRSKVIQHGTTQYFNPHMYTLAPAGYLGNVGRNSLRGPDYVNLDFSVVKDTKLRWLGDAGALQFRTEMFNILNHPNYGEPNATVLSATGIVSGAGLISNLINPNAQRQIQFALRASF